MSRLDQNVADLPEPPRYATFIEQVRRYRPSDLLPRVAAVAADISDRHETSTEQWRLLSPWGLAAMARDSMVRGNDHRRPAIVTTERIQELHNLFSNTYDPPDPASGALEILAQLGYEQFSYQESDGEEVARTYAMFNGALRATSTTAVTPETFLGGTVEDVLTAAMVVYAVARHSSGRWASALLDGSAEREIAPTMPAGLVAQIANGMTAGLSEIRHDFAAVRQSAIPRLARYAYNPLHKTPLVRLPDGLVIAPQSRLILKRYSPAGLYYAGLTHFGKDFGDDLGWIAQTYVGQLLGLMNGALVLPEIVHGRPEERSIDWFAVFDDLVLLVEVKSSRPVIGMRMGDASLGDSLKGRLNRAIGQLHRAAAAIGTNPAFDRVPNDRPKIGLVVTAEPYYWANSGIVRSLLEQPSVPTLMASIRELEYMTSHDARTIEAALKAIVESDEATWQLSTSLARHVPPGKRNPILEAAWQSLPFNVADADAEQA
jgi:hypothetical protein